MQHSSSPLDLPQATAEPFGQWLRDPERGAFWLLIAACVAPIWAFAYFPSQDGPAHVYNAMILRDYHGAQGAAFRTYFELNFHPEPNLLGHWLMAALMSVVQPRIAEKVLITLYIVIFPLSVRYAVRAVSRGSGFLAYLSFPLIYNFALHKGLYNFCLSLPLFFFFVGYWVRCEGRFDLRSAGVLVGLSLLLYFAHVVSLLEAYVIVGLFAATQWILEFTGPKAIEPGRPPLRQRILSRVALPMAALAPTLAMLASFFHRQSGESREARSPLLRELLKFSSLISYRMSESRWSCSVVLLFVILTLYGLWRLLIQRRRARGDWLLLAVGMALLLYFVVPNAAAGGGGISPRLMLFIYFLLILWFACSPLPNWGRNAVRIAAALLCVGMLATYVHRYRQFNVDLLDYAECAPLIERGSTLMPICLSDGNLANPKELRFHNGLRAYLHTSGYVAAERGLVDLSNYEATQNYFPVLFRSDLSPAPSDPAQAPRLGEYGQGLLNYPRQTGGRGRIDYVLVWDTGDKGTASMPAQTQQDLDRGYHWIHTSPLGFARLYQRNEAPP